MREDVQALLQKVTIQPDEAFSKRFPAEMPCRIQITLKDGRKLAIEKQDNEGFSTRPMSWEKAVARKFLDAGAYMIMIESEGITENVKTWRTDQSRLDFAPRGGQ